MQSWQRRKKWHNNLSAGTRTFKPGTRGAELIPELNVVSDRIFTKVKSNALTSEAFDVFIQEYEISEFYVVGADTAACIKSTCYNMMKSVYTVHVLSDCITSYDKKKLPELLTYYESKGNSDSIARAVSEEFCSKLRFGNCRNPLCISRFSNRSVGEKDPLSAAAD